MLLNFIKILYCRPVMMELPGGENIISIRAEKVDELTSLPIIVHNVTVLPNLKYVMHTNGMELSVRKVSQVMFDSFRTVKLV